MNELETTPGKEFTGRHMLLLAVAFFGVVILLDFQTQAIFSISPILPNSSSNFLGLDLNF